MGTDLVSFDWSVNGEYAGRIRFGNDVGDNDKQLFGHFLAVLALAPGWWNHSSYPEDPTIEKISLETQN